MKLNHNASEIFFFFSPNRFMNHRLTRKLDLKVIGKFNNRLYKLYRLYWFNKFKCLSKLWLCWLSRLYRLNRLYRLKMLNRLSNVNWLNIFNSFCKWNLLINRLNTFSKLNLFSWLNYRLNWLSRYNSLHNRLSLSIDTTTFWSDNKFQHANLLKTLWYFRLWLIWHPFLWIVIDDCKIISSVRSKML